RLHDGHRLSVATSLPTHLNRKSLGNPQHDPARLSDPIKTRDAYCGSARKKRAYEAEGTTTCPAPSTFDPAGAEARESLFEPSRIAAADAGRLWVFDSQPAPRHCDRGRAVRMLLRRSHSSSHAG